MAARNFFTGAKTIRGHPLLRYTNRLDGGRMFQAIRVIHAERDKYLNKDRGILEHFKYPNLFIRRTKKAFINLTIPKVLETTVKESGSSSCQNITYYGSGLHMRPKGIQMHMKYCRRVYASHLRTQGIGTETTDLLQGRV